MVVFIIFCMMIGAALGSFACCQAWRIRLKEGGKKNPGKRSVCLSCGKKLKWYENIPIVSWVAQGGKCRECGREIGKAEILAEILGAVGFGILGIRFWEDYFKWVFCSGIAGPMCFSGLVVWIGLMEVCIVVIFTTILLILGVYDAKWKELPGKLLWTAVIFGVILAGVKVILRKQEVLSTLAAVGILAGIYYILYKVSKEKWVGGGDWILCLAIALVLGEPFLALIELSLANILGLVVMLPQRNRKKMIPFGPFLVGAFVLIFGLSPLML